jgi:hypothetical protein
VVDQIYNITKFGPGREGGCAYGSLELAISAPFLVELGKRGVGRVGRARKVCNSGDGARVPPPTTLGRSARGVAQVAPLVRRQPQRRSQAKSVAIAMIDAHRDRVQIHTILFALRRQM